MTGSFVVQKQLLVEASLLKRLVAPGDEQAIDVKVIDANTKEIVPGANVMAKIGKENGYNGTSDTSGAYSHSWNITSDIASGKYDVWFQHLPMVTNQLIDREFRSSKTIVG